MACRAGRLLTLRAPEAKLAKLERRHQELMFSEHELTDAEMIERFEVMEKIQAGERVPARLKNG